jgi:hypothetical protein
MKKVISVILVTIVTSSCIDERDYAQRQREHIEYKELIFETEHCRFYCLERNGSKHCMVIVCECDSGYSADVSTSWN